MKLKNYVLGIMLVTVSTSMLWLDHGRSLDLGESNNEEITNLVNRYVENRDFNGAILVAKGGDILYKKGLGFANMEWDVPNSSNTKFRLGSITKQFTAMAIMQLVEEGKLDLHKGISNYLPDYPKNNGERITIHHLLTHTSGIPNNYESEYVKEKRPDAESPQKLVNEFSNLDLEFNPGEKFKYSNAGYQVLGLLIEKITGKRYEEVLTERIFKPLEMNDTGFDKHRALIQRRADGYFNSYGKYYNSNYVNMSKVFAAGALFSTVEDLYKWDRALYTESLLGESLMKDIFTKHVEDIDYGGHYAYGWSILDKTIGNTNKKVTTYSHDGVIDGFCAIFTRIPSENASIILLSNVRRAPLNAMTRGIIGILLEEEYDFPRKSLAYASLDIMNEKGINQGLDFFRENTTGEEYFLVEEEVNIISYLLHESSRTEAAASFLELGLLSFPKAFNLYDSYGEILRNLGRIEESIKNYKISIDLNPDNVNGIRMLKEMGINYPTEKVE